MLAAGSAHFRSVNKHSWAQSMDNSLCFDPLRDAQIHTTLFSVGERAYVSQLRPKDGVVEAGSPEEGAFIFCRD